MSIPGLLRNPVNAFTAAAPAAGSGGSDLARLGRGGRLGLIGAMSSAVANFAVVLAVTRGFGRHDAGLFFSATSVFLVLEILSRLGTDLASVYFIARLRALGDSHLIAVHLRVALKPVIGLSVVAAGALALSADWLSRHLLSGSPSLTLRIIAVCLPFAVVYDVCISATRGFGTVVAATSLEKILRPGCQLVFVAVAAVIGKPGGLAIAWAAPYLIFLPVAAWVLIRLVAREDVPQRGAECDIRRTFWAFAAPRTVTGLAQVLLQRLDVVIVAALLGLPAAATYAAATRFLVLGQFGNQAISSPVEPRLSALLARGDLPAAKAVYSASTAWLVCINWPFFLFTAIYSSTIMTAFGPSYASGWTVTTTLCLSMLVATGVGLVDAVLIMAGRTSWNLYNTLAALTLNVGLDLLLLPRIGLIGAALAWAVAILTTNIVPLVQIKRLLGLHPFGRSVATAFGVAFTAFGLIPGAIRLLLGPGIPSLLAAGLAAMLVYALLLRRYHASLQLSLLIGRLTKLRRLASRAGGRHRRPDSDIPAAEPSTDRQVER